jgi:hypothetical protein
MIPARILAGVFMGHEISRKFAAIIEQARSGEEV